VIGPFTRFSRALALLILLSGGLAMPTRAASSPVLETCPGSPNCVSSLAADEVHRVEPIRFSGDADAALARMRRVIEKEPRTQIVSASADELRAEFKSLVFRFVDDVHIVLDREAGVLHIRSASRTGSSDFGVNRKRVKRLSEAFARVD
jgi:uncharacterized protein (DUF1499 family)